MLKRPKNVPEVPVHAKPPVQSSLSPSVQDEAAPPAYPNMDDNILQNPGAMLGTILVQTGHISEAQLEEGLRKHRAEGGFLGQSLIELEYIDQQTLTLVLIKQCKIPHLNLLDYQIDPDVASIIPAPLVRKHQVLPIDKMGRILTVAMVDPLNAATLTALRTAFPDLRIKPILCDWPHYEATVNKLFGNDQSGKSTTMSVEDFGLTSKPTVKSNVVDITPAPTQLSEESEILDALGLTDTPPESGTPTISEAPVVRQNPSVTSEVPAPIDSTKVEYQTMFSQMDQKLGMLADTVTRMVESNESLKHREVEDVRRHTRADLRHRGYSVGTIAQHAPQHFQEKDDRDARVLESLESGMPVAGYSFRNFFPGKTNDVAYKTACAVAESPGGAFNPLFVYGKVGLGKTHLINAIGNHVVTQNSGVRVGYISASRFANHLLEAQETQSTKAFREQYSHWDILILDDIQFLGGHIEAQEEFFHIFNGLHQQGRQIIIAGDKSPERLGLLEQRLVSRFASGMVSVIKPPEWETRIEILKHSAAQSNLDTPDEVFAMIAMRVSSDVRMLVGALTKIMALSKLQNVPVSAELTNTILTEMGIEEAA